MAIGFRSIGALRAIRLSDATRSALGDSYAQLASGKRITRPSDDPGGLAVSMSLAVEAKISDRAKLNIEDGVSLSSFAAAAFDSATDLVQRMNELASQAANGILGTTQRSALNAEFTALRDELSRIQKSSQFNGIKVNDGSATSATSKRVGANGSSSFEMSGDGRLVFYVEGSSLKVRDTITDTISVLETSVSSTDIGVSAAGDKIAYLKGGAVRLFDRLSGTSQSIIAGVSSAAGIEISGDGSTVAVAARTYYNAAGTSYSSDGNYHLITYDVGNGSIRGDGARYNIGLLDSRDLQVSYNGDYVAFRGSESVELGVSEEVVVFQSGDLAGDYLFATGTANKMVAGFGLDNSGNVYGVVGGAEDVLAKFNIDNKTGGLVIYNRLVYFRGIADAGGALLFSNTENITGDNPQNKTQLFKLDLLSGEVRQVSKFTSTVNFSSSDRFSGDGYSWINFTSASGTYDYYDSSPRLGIDIETGNGARGLVGVSILALDGAARALKGLSIDTLSAAKSVIYQLSRTKESISLAQSALGASMSRLQSSSRATASRGLEQQAAFGRVTDVDTAEAAGAMVRLQILNQSQIGVVAQASKLSPQIALKLLVGP